ncbi:MAG: hypothetical protein ABIO67_03535 [Mycobacteriales bacterium]
MPLTRRDVLLAGVLTVTTAACTSISEPAPQAPPDPDISLRGAAIVRERTLLVAYDAALIAHPSLRATLAPLRADHATHLDRLTGQLPGTPAPAADPTPPSAPPATAAGQRAALRALERSTQAAHRDAAITASRVLAPVLASLAACEASHAVVL